MFDGSANLGRVACMLTCPLDIDFFRLINESFSKQLISFLFHGPAKNKMSDRQQLEWEFCKVTRARLGMVECTVSKN